MREILTYAFGWFGGALLFAGLIVALAQVGGLTRLRPQPGSTPDKRQCTRVVRKANQYARLFVVRLEWLVTILLAALALGITRSAAATLAVTVGALAGQCLSRRQTWHHRNRLVATAACIAGIIALVSGTGGFLAAPASFATPIGVRIAFFSAVTLGASLLGAAVVAYADASRGRKRTALTSGDRALRVIALLLCAALGHSFIATLHATEAGLSILGAAAVLGTALGAQFMLMLRRSVTKPAPAQSCRVDARVSGGLDNRAAFVARYAGCTHIEQSAPPRQHATSRRHATL